MSTPTTPSTSVAVLGTGRMGGTIARRLAAQGVPLVLWNRTPERIPDDIGATIAPTPAAAARGARVVLSSLTGPEAVRQVYLGADGAASVGGRLFAEMSTVGPSAVLELEPEVRAGGSRIIDAPVIGSVDAVAAGTLQILAGGAREDVEEAEPILRQLGSVRFVGPLGSGAKLKLVSNAMLGGSLALAAELQRLGTAAGLDPRDVFWALAARFPYVGHQERAFLEHRHDQVAFALRDLTKDLDLSESLERGADLRAPIVDLARQLFDQAPGELAGLNVTAILEADA
jgi:2-hydroxy-3-oxopropionate reductase